MLDFANAKINIGLQITGVRKDGYHFINTILYPLYGLKDIVEINKSPYTGIVITGIKLDVPVEQNLVYRAYKFLARDYDLSPVSIFLHKNIPYGAGLGGGSSDAAVVLHLLNKIFDLRLSDDKLIKYAANLGADCAFFIKNKPAYATGIGEELFDVELDLENYNIVVVKPDFGISTKDAYALVDTKQPEFDLRNIHQLPIEQWKNYVFNDFEPVLFEKYPLLSRIKSQLYELGAIYASLSGSGSAIFGIFDHKIDISKLNYTFVWQSKN